MRNKTIIGSIIASAILILVSFTGVVGYQTTKSSTIAITSPLFTVRSSRAIDEESKDFTCDYMGKGEVNNIYLPKGNNDRTDSLDTLINVIKRMDDKSLQRFAYFIKYRLQQTDSTPDFDSKDIFQLLKQLRDNPDSINSNIEKETEETFYFSCTCPSIGNRQPLKCLQFLLLMLPILLLLLPIILIEIILEFLTYEPYTCE